LIAEIKQKLLTEPDGRLTVEIKQQLSAIFYKYLNCDVAIEKSLKIMFLFLFYFYFEGVNFKYKI